VTYTFTIIPVSIVNRYSYIELTLPPEVGIANANLIEFKCGGSISGFTSSSVFCSIYGQVIQIKNGFNSGSSTNDPP